MHGKVYVSFVHWPRLHHIEGVEAVRKQTTLSLLLRRLLRKNNHTVRVTVRSTASHGQWGADKRAVLQYCRRRFQRVGFLIDDIKLERTRGPGLYDGHYGALYTVRITTRPMTMKEWRGR